MAGYRAWEMPRAGCLTRLRLTERPLPPTPSGQVLVRVAAAGLNFADVFACLGLYSATPKGAFVPGLEFAGTVLEAPAGSGFTSGQAVMGVTRFAGYASHVTADPRALLPLPGGWRPVDGAAFPVQAITAWCALVELGQLRPGQTVLVQSAAGGVGLQALRIIERLGGRAIGTVGRPAKAEYLRQHHPAAIPIVRDRRRFAAQLDEALDGAGATGFQLVLDSLAGEWFAPAWERLTPFGRQVLFGAASLTPPGDRPNWPALAWRYLRRPRLDPLAMVSQNRSLMAFNLIWMWEDLDFLRGLAVAVTELALPPPPIDRIFPFAEAPAALRHLQQGGTIGKVVLTVD
jgi:alcohol dehydrogenase